MIEYDDIATNALCLIHNQLTSTINNPRDCDYQNLNRSVVEIKQELIKRNLVSELVLNYRGKL